MFRGRDGRSHRKSIEIKILSYQRSASMEPFCRHPTLHQLRVQSLAIRSPSSQTYMRHIQYGESLLRLKRSDFVQRFHPLLRYVLAALTPTVLATVPMHPMAVESPPVALWARDLLVIPTDRFVERNPHESRAHYHGRDGAAIEVIVST